VYMWGLSHIGKIGSKAPLSLLYKEAIVFIYINNHNTIQCSPLCVYASALSLILPLYIQYI
jgi:hypothetical protein